MPHTIDQPSPHSPSSLSGWLSRVIVALLGVLLVEVLLESWVVTALGDVGWPKTLKSVLYFVLLGLTVAKLTIDRSWGRLRTKADLALLITGLVMVAAGIFGGSDALLISQAMFVYFRGVLVFYAMRAVAPGWRAFTPLLWAGGIIIAVNCLVAMVQFAVGEPVYSALGWVELQWAGENRAHGLLEHPNDLGHVTGFMLLGLLAWFLAQEKVKARWWALFALIAVGLSVAQSRLSLVATLLAVAVLAVVRLRAARLAGAARWPALKRLVVAGAVIGVIGAAPMVVLKENRDDLVYRVGGLINSLFMSGGEDSRKECLDPNEPECDGEIRILFIKQGSRLWAASPVIGYGVGQFGGIVAVRQDPQWNLDPRFQEVLGPNGFYLFEFESTSVDVFWLHLLVEVGALGFIAYVAWMYLISAPLVRAAIRRPQGRQADAIFLWSTAALAFAVLIATWSPSLEDPLFPPMLFGVLGFGWVLWCSKPSSPDSAAVTAADEDTVRPERRSET